MILKNVINLHLKTNNIFIVKKIRKYKVGWIIKRK